jgi:ribonuclease VapC
MFIDASAIVAILAEEDDAAHLIAQIDGYKRPIYYSALSVFEAVVSLAKITALSHGLDQKPIPPKMIEQAKDDVESLLKTIGAREMAIGAGIQKHALEAAQLFGRFVGHQARLNFGDCFSYACAKANHMPLLFKGDDFRKTDIDRV